VLKAGARITSFLPILTTRKVREILRQRRHPARASEAPAPREVDARVHAPTAPSDGTGLSPVYGKLRAVVKRWYPDLQLEEEPQAGSPGG
jgi:hypothetical protein